jgi:hypothetical protein
MKLTIFTVASASQLKEAQQLETELRYAMGDDIDFQLSSTKHIPQAFQEMTLYTEADWLVYLALDSEVVDDCLPFLLKNILVQYAESDMLLLPAIAQPLANKVLPDEKYYLLTGLYSDGFLALRNTPNTQTMLKWWLARIESQKMCNQRVWLNHVPVFFDKVVILTKEIKGIHFEKELTIKYAFRQVLKSMIRIIDTIEI